MEIRRRGFLGLVLGGAAVLAAPAIIRTPGLLMPIQPPLRDTRFWQLSKVYMAEPGNEIALPWFVQGQRTTWQRPADSILRYDGIGYKPDWRLVLAKTYIEIPAGADLASIGNDWNVEGASSSRLSRL